MTRIKSYLCLIPVLAMLLALTAGCSSNKGNSTETQTPANDATASNTSTSSTSADGSTFSFSEDIDENGFWKGIKALDYVDKFDYLALPIPSDTYTISESSLQTEIDNIMATYAYEEQITDRAVVDGDTVNIDYVGSVDGVEFDGGSTSGNGTNVTIGVTSYIDDFLEQVIGHTAGETFDIEVTFPDAYQNESLQGKDAVFVTTVNYIVEKGQPELTDDFVKTNLFETYGWETVSKMREGLNADLQKKAIQNYVSTYLSDEVTVSSIPDKIMECQEQAMLQYYQIGAENYDMTFDEFLSSYLGVSSTEELLENNHDNNVKNAAYTLVSQAVAEDAGISVSDADVTDYFTDSSQLEEQYGMPYLKQFVLSQKVIEYIADKAVLE